MDADDRAHPERLAAQVAYLRENPQVNVVNCICTPTFERVRRRILASRLPNGLMVEWAHAVNNPE